MKINTGIFPCSILTVILILMANYYLNSKSFTMPREKMTLKTYEWDGTKGRLAKKPVAKNYDMPHTDENNGTNNAKSYGMPITVSAFQEMVKKFKDEAALDHTIFSKLLQVTFSKSSIMRVLSQEKCEYISILQAMTEEELEDGSKKKKVTFVLQGLDLERKPVKAELLFKTNEDAVGERIHNDEDPIIEERGNGEDEPEPLKSLTSDKLSSQSLSDFMKDLFTAIAKR